MMNSQFGFLLTDERGGDHLDDVGAVEGRELRARLAHGVDLVAVLHPGGPGSGLVLL